MHAAAQFVVYAIAAVGGLVIVMAFFGMFTIDDHRLGLQHRADHDDDIEYDPEPEPEPPPAELPRAIVHRGDS